MAKKSISRDQFSFDFGDEPAPPPVLIQVRKERVFTYYEGLVAQIARDMETLKMDPEFWSPNREFYEERIVSFREAAKEYLVRRERDALDGDDSMAFFKDQNEVRYT